MTTGWKFGGYLHDLENIHLPSFWSFNIHIFPGISCWTIPSSKHSRWEKRQPQLHSIPHARTFWHYSLSRMTSSSLDQRSRGQTNKYSHEIPYFGGFTNEKTWEHNTKLPDSIIFLAGSPANVDSLGITVWKITQNNLQPGGPVKKHEIYVISHFCWLLVD